MDCERNHSIRIPMDGTPHSPKTDSDHLIKDNWRRHHSFFPFTVSKVYGQWRLRLSLIRRSLSVFGLWGVPSIGLLMLWLRSQSIMINNSTQQSSNTSQYRINRACTITGLWCYILALMYLNWWTALYILCIWVVTWFHFPRDYQSLTIDCTYTAAVMWLCSTDITYQWQWSLQS